jgi:serine O-acetyltransferase
MLKDLSADLGRFLGLADRPLSTLTKVRALAETQGVWAVCVYRFGRWVWRDSPRPLRVPLKLAYFVAQKFVESTTGIQIPAATNIGKGLYIGHFGMIVVHPEATIGENCDLSHGVTIGVRGGPRPGVPRIGNNVYLGTGAKVLGPVTIGDGAQVGANAVVLSDVPAGATAVGVPARIVSPRPRAVVDATG